MPEFQNAKGFAPLRLATEVFSLYMHAKNKPDRFWKPDGLYIIVYLSNRNEWLLQGIFLLLYKKELTTLRNKL